MKNQEKRRRNEYCIRADKGYYRNARSDGKQAVFVRIFNGNTECTGKFQKEAGKENLDMVIGSRFINNQGFQSSAVRRFGIRFFEVLLRILFGQKITDATSGMRMCNRKVMEFFIKDYPKDYPEPETVARLLRHKCKVKEIPVIMRERQAGVSSISSLRKSAYYMCKVSLAILIERLR